MTDGKKEVSVAIVGLGQVGSTFLDKLATKEGSGVNIVAAAELNSSAPGVESAKSKGIEVHEGTKELVAMGDSVDIIFDLTGNPEAKRNLRSELARSGNQHTVIAPEVVAFLIWDLMGESKEFPGGHTSKGY
ncbi:MAG: hypothetical protein KAR06_07000 [Deltaproteobacteria bacterium]|nr:hypothetical protein [Deltaproteobacteria bacterium]